MKIIVGLGNPGKEYEGTRHNAGFMFLDKLLIDPEINSVGEELKFKNEPKFKAEVSEAKLNGERLILVKPQTFMNLSGQAVQKILNFYKADLSYLIVISDDIDLPVGILRIRHEGSSGGQKGLQNIIDTVGDNGFTRFRIGTLEGNDKIQQSEVNNYVLGKIGKRAIPVINDIISLGVEYLIEHLKDGKEIPAHTLEIVDSGL